MAGWRLATLIPQTDSLPSNVGVFEEGSDLQGRRLVRMYEFPRGKDGWRGMSKFMNRIVDIVEEEDVSIFWLLDSYIILVISNINL